MLSLIWSWLQPFIAVIIPAAVLASPWIAMVIPVVGPGVSKILRWCPPIPIFILVAAAAWVWLDRDGAIMRAARDATKELVAGEELAAAKQREAGQRVIIDTLQRQNESYLKSLTSLSAKMADLREADQKQLQEDLDANKSDGAGDDAISDRLFDRLRNK